jgi:glycosyltransferase involved in cell wall biosynthesis
VRAAIGPDDALIVRAGSELAALAIAATGRDRPFGAEVVGDPYDVFAPGAVRHPLRPYFRWRYPRLLRAQCRRACAAQYVTERTLQERYPAGGPAFAVSNVDLPGEAIRETALIPPTPPLPILGKGGQVTVTMVGSLAQMYKAPDVLIDAVAILAGEGMPVRLALIGDGKHREELARRARERGIGERVTFLGQLPPGEAIRERLDETDVFVLPSRTEGLPRAMIEAMARGLPCIGSTAGGIPELLPPEDMVPPGDVAALAAKLREVIGDPARRARMAARNLEVAKRYRAEVLRERRLEFHRLVRGCTEAWLTARASVADAHRAANSLEAMSS